MFHEAFDIAASHAEVLANVRDSRPIRFSDFLGDDTPIMSFCLGDYKRVCHRSTFKAFLIPHQRLKMCDLEYSDNEL